MSTTTEKGYGAAHQAERRRWQAQINQGPVQCARCQTPILPGDKWELDHTDDKTAYLGPSCMTCNRSAGGRKGRASQLGPSAVIRDW